MNLFTIMKKLRMLSVYIPYLPKIIYFNFHYLPFSQAMKLPILLYKPTFKCLGGTISISTDPDSKLKFGMIRLGDNRVSIYPNTGIMLELRGNVTFHGSCNIGNNSYISTWENSHIDFGDNFCSTTSLKLVCYKK